MEVKVINGSIFIDGVEYVPKVRNNLIRYSRQINKSDAFFSEMKYKRTEQYKYIHKLGDGNLAKGYNLYQDDISRCRELLLDRLKTNRRSMALHRKARKLIENKSNRSNFFMSVRSSENISFKNYKRMKELLNES
jgi:hypothetical protein